MAASPIAVAMPALAQVGVPHRRHPRSTPSRRRRAAVGVLANAAWLVENTTGGAATRGRAG